MASLKTPRNSREISQAWLEGILTEYESKTQAGTSVEVISFQVNPGAKPGENFGSELVKVTVEGRVSCIKDRDTTADPKTYHLVAKFLLGDEFQQAGIKYVKAHLRELLIYSEVIAELNNFQSSHISQDDEYRVDIPKFIYGKCTETEYVLVLENLSPAGYANADKRQGLSLEEAMMAVGSLAKLHGVSYAYNKTKGKFTEKYPEFEPPEIIAFFFKTFITVVYEALYKILENNKTHDDLHKKMKNNRDVIINKSFKSVFDDNVDSIYCLCHGDYWTNNLLIKHREATEENVATLESVFLIDWANSLWNKPMLDVQYLVHSSCALTLRQNHLEEILRHYYSTFTTITAHLKDPIITCWSYEDFKEEWNKSKLYGVVMGGMVNIVTLSEAGKTFRENQLKKTTSDGVMGKIKTNLAKTLMSLFTKQWSQPLAKSAFKQMFSPMMKEAKAGTNETMMNRVLDLLTEGDEYGIFDA